MVGLGISKNHQCRRMSGWKLGSTVNGSMGLSYNLIFFNGIYYCYDPLLTKLGEVMPGYAGREGVHTLPETAKMAGPKT